MNTATISKNGEIEQSISEFGEGGEFNFENFQLSVGDNHVLVSGIDITGEETTDSILITYNQNYDFLSSPELSENTAVTEEQAGLYLSIAIDVVEGLDNADIQLYEVTENGETIGDKLANLLDDGDVGNGDDIAGDGVYSTYFSVTKSEPGRAYYRVVIADPDLEVNEFSSLAEVYFYKNLSDEEITATSDDFDITVDSYFGDSGESFSSSQLDSKISQLADDFASNESVESAELSEDGSSINVLYNNGLKFSLYFFEKGSSQGSSVKGAPRNNVGLKYPGKTQPDISYSKYTYNPNTVSALITDVSDNANSIGKYSAMAISPFYTEFSPKDGNDAYTLIENSDSPFFNAQTLLKDSDSGIEDFKNLSDFGVVMISSHGAVFQGEPIIMTSQIADSTSIHDYLADIVAGRILVSQAVELTGNGEDSHTVSLSTQLTFSLTHDFISEYSGSMSNSLVYLGICHGLSGNVLANAFLGAGAGAIVGYDNSVLSGYDYDVIQTFINHMLDGFTVSESVDFAKSEHGENDAIWAENNSISGASDEPAEFVMLGNPDLILERFSLENGSFESNLDYWDGNGGDSRVITQLSSLVPPHESFMAIISSGLGSVDDSESIIFQSFTLPDDVQLIHFSYNVVSEEPMEWVGSEFNDQFRVVLIDASGNEVELAYESINTSTWIEIVGSQSDGGMFDGGDSTAFHTDWKLIDFDISEFAGQSVTIQFRVWDVGDSAYDTAALIDNIYIE